MTFTLDSIKTSSKPKPPCIVIHGVHGVGKTSFAAQAPSPVFIRTEDGLGRLSVPAFPIAKSYGDVLDAIKALHGEHAHKTAVLDSVDWLEPLVWERTCFEKGKPGGGIEDFGYGKGYTYADDFWREFLNELTRLRDERGMSVILIAHTEIRNFKSPDSEPYDRYMLKLHKRASALIDEWADIIGFAKYEVFTEQTDVGFNKKVTRGVGTGQRLLALEERPAYDAKNRYGLPPEIPLQWVELKKALKAAFTSAAAPVTEEEPVNV
jgi:hypothetical protein